MAKKKWILAVLAGASCAALCAIAATAQAQSAEDFFRKADRLTMYVGSGAGGGSDQVARFVARNLSRFLPGNPPFVVENRPIATGIEASNFLYNSAPRDGSVILSDSQTALALPIFGSPAAHYDPRRFEWIGSTGKKQAICLTWKTSGIKTLEDATKREVTVSATSLGVDPSTYPIVLNALFGTKFKVIAGYSTSGMPLAVERGEVDGLCGYAWESYVADGSQWFANQDVNILLQMGLEKDPDLPDVPLADDLVKNPADRQLLDLIELPKEFGYPFIAPPGTPADRMAIYRRAFQEMVRDPQFLAEAQKQRIAIEPLDDRQIGILLDRAYSIPKDIHDRAAAFLAPKN